MGNGDWTMLVGLTIGDCLKDWLRLGILVLEIFRSNGGGAAWEVGGDVGVAYSLGGLFGGEGCLKDKAEETRDMAPSLSDLSECLSASGSRPLISGWVTSPFIAASLAASLASALAFLSRCSRRAARYPSNPEFPFTAFCHMIPPNARQM